MPLAAVQRFTHQARRAADATPPDRDRYLDLLRALAIGVVVIGHWLVAAIWVTPDGLQVAGALTIEPATRILTWGLQVMPVFFLVGGVVGARSWRSARRAGTPWVAWARGRAARLLRPSVVLLWAWVAIAGAALALGVEPGLLKTASQAALVPLWFLAVYLIVVALTPVLAAAVARWRLVVPLALTAAAGLVDAVHYGTPPAGGLAGGLPVGAVNFIVVWSAAYTLGIAWGDGLLDRIPGWALAVVGFAVLAALVTWAGYPLSMVGVDGAGRSNNAPPSVAIAVLGWAQTGVVLGLAPAARRWLARRRVWQTVVGLNFAVMTVYLWHLTVMVGVAGALYAAGVGLDIAPLSAAWWATRPLWIAGLSALLLPVVALLAPVELSTPRPAAVAGARATVTFGVALASAAAAVATIVLYGAADVSRTLALTAVVHAAAVAAGAWRLPLRLRHRTSREAGVPGRRSGRPATRASASASPAP